MKINNYRNNKVNKKEEMSRFAEENVAHLDFGDDFFNNSIKAVSNDEIFCLLQGQLSSTE